MSDLPLADEPSQVSRSVQPREISLGVIKETASEKEYRLKREALLEIKRKIAEPGGNFGVKIINRGKSYNKFATLPYSELEKIKKKENKFRKVLGVKKDKRPVNNMDWGFKPEVDPRVLNTCLKRKRNYYGGGRLNMVEVKGTNYLKDKKVEKIEMQGGEPGPDDLKEFQTDSILQRQEEAGRAKRRAIGNGRLASYGAKNVRIQECTFQKEQKVVRFSTDVVGDPKIKEFRAEHQAVPHKVKQMTQHKLEVVSKKRLYDEQDNIFRKTKKGKEMERFIQRDRLPEYSPEAKKAPEKKPVGQADDVVRPQHVPPNYYDRLKARTDRKDKKKVDQDLQVQARAIPAVTFKEQKEAKAYRYQDPKALSRFGFKLNPNPKPGSLEALLAAPVPEEDKKTEIEVTGMFGVEMESTGKLKPQFLSETGSALHQPEDKDSIADPSKKEPEKKPEEKKPAAKAPLPPSAKRLQKKPQQALPPRPPTTIYRLDPSVGEQQNQNALPAITNFGINKSAVKKKRPESARNPVSAQTYFSAHKDQLQERKNEKDGFYKSIYEDSTAEKETQPSASKQKRSQKERQEAWKALAAGKSSVPQSERIRKKFNRPSSAVWSAGSPKKTETKMIDKSHQILKPVEVRTNRNYRNLASLWIKEKMAKSKSLNRLSNMYSEGEPKGNADKTMERAQQQMKLDFLMKRGKLRNEGITTQIRVADEMKKELTRTVAETDDALRESHAEFKSMVDEARTEKVVNYDLLREALCASEDDKVLEHTRMRYNPQLELYI